jgi:hypothetical protein
VGDDRLLISLRWITRFLLVGLCGSTLFLVQRIILWHRGPSLPAEVSFTEASSDTFAFPPVPPVSQYESAWQRPGLFVSASDEPGPTPRSEEQAPKAPSPQRLALRLLGIVHGEPSQAIIATGSGRTYTVGPDDRVEEFLVRSIEPGRVMLDDDGDLFALSL